MKTEDKDKEVIDALCRAFEMEVEKVESYLEASANAEGMQALSLRVILEREVEDELQHARRLGERIKALGGTVPGSQQLKDSQNLTQTPADSSDVFSIIGGVIAAEEAAIEHYRNLVEITEGHDRLTCTLATELLKDEERHRQEFKGFVWGKTTEKPKRRVPAKEPVFQHACVA